MIQLPTLCNGKLWILPLVQFALATLLLAYHANAENVDGVADMNLWSRVISGPNSWTKMDTAVFCIIIMMAMELLNFLVKNSGVWANAKQIPVRGKHLDEFTTTDRLFVGISKAQTGPFVYFLLRYCFHEKNVLWALDQASVRNIVLPLPLIFIIFDFFYTTMHWALHIKAIYGFVHKHHHVQKAPSRANIDAINVHPLEFFLGEYNHLWSLFLCTRVFSVPVHALGVLLFLVVGGALAGLNHTRFDVEVPFLGVKVFDSKAHDVHHRIPQSNYGQYTMFWDVIFGTYRPYNPKDRVNPKAQLDPKSGKSIEYVKAQNLHEQ